MQTKTSCKTIKGRAYITREFDGVTAPSSPGTMINATLHSHLDKNDSSFSKTLANPLNGHDVMISRIHKAF